MVGRSNYLQEVTSCLLAGLDIVFILVFNKFKMSTLTVALVSRGLVALEFIHSWSKR